MKIDKKEIRAVLKAAENLKENGGGLSISCKREEIYIKQLRSYFPEYRSFSEDSSKLMLQKLLSYKGERYINMATPAGVPVIKSFSNTPAPKKSPVLGHNHQYSIDTKDMSIARTETFFS